MLNKTVWGVVAEKANHAIAWAAYAEANQRTLMFMNSSEKLFWFYRLTGCLRLDQAKGGTLCV